MKAKIKRGTEVIEVEGTPQEIAEFVRADKIPPHANTTQETYPYSTTTDSVPQPWAKPVRIHQYYTLKVNDTGLQLFSELLNPNDC